MLAAGSKKSAAVDRGRISCAYAVFITGAFIVYKLFAEGEFSSVLTLSAIGQTLAFSLLGIQFISYGAVGISFKSLQLDALALICRLSSTLIFEGYLPSDMTGDYLYQTFDGFSLAMVLYLMFKVKRSRDMYDAAEDTFPGVQLALATAILAGLLHANLNDNAFFDALWMWGTFVSAVAVVPQLWLMSRSHGCVSALTSHFVATMAISRFLSGLYMWHAHDEITSDPWFGKFNHAGYAILLAHAVHMLLLGDFAYFYCKNVATAGLQTPLELPQTWSV
jgi:hypothetical protein